MGKLLVTFALALGASCAVATPILAQTSNPRGGVTTPDLRRRTTVREFDNGLADRRLDGAIPPAAMYAQANEIAECVARRGRDKADTYLGGQLLGDPDYQRIAEALTGRLRNCANSAATASAVAISGALAEQLLTARSASFEDRAAAVNVDDAQRFYGDLSGVVTFDNVAGCLVVYSPGLAHKVLKAEIDSAEETAALEALYRATPECRMSSPPAGISALTQRATLAAALYKWSTLAS